jgi:hypothetical protein
MMVNQDADVVTVVGPLFDNIVPGETGDDTRKEGLADCDGEAAGIEWYEVHSDITLSYSNITL